MPLLVRHRYLAVVPHILVAICYITNVLVYVNGRVSVYRRTHLDIPVVFLAARDGSSDRAIQLKDAVMRKKEIFKQIWTMVGEEESQGFTSTP